MFCKVAFVLQNGNKKIRFSFKNKGLAAFEIKKSIDFFVNFNWVLPFLNETYFTIF